MNMVLKKMCFSYLRYKINKMNLIIIVKGPINPEHPLQAVGGLRLHDADLQDQGSPASGGGTVRASSRAGGAASSRHGAYSVTSLAVLAVLASLAPLAPLADIATAHALHAGTACCHR